MEISPGVEVQQTGSQIKLPPRFSLSGLYVTVGPHVSRESHEQLLSKTFGSTDWLWSGDDEYRFDSEDATLKAVVLATPENVSGKGEVLNAWTALPVMTGGLRAAKVSNFDARPMSSRWVSGDGLHMACVQDDLVGTTGSPERLRIAESLDFIFEGGVLAGWMLESPAWYLVRDSEFPSPSNCDASLHVFLKRFLSISTEANVEALQEGSATVHSSLVELRGELDSLPATHQRDILMHQIDELVEEFGP